MQFRFIGVVPGLGLHENGSSELAFMLGKISVELRSETVDHRLQLHCEATTEIELTPKLLRSFESLAANQLPPGSLPPDQWEKPLAQVDPCGVIRGPLRSVPMSYLPQAFQQFAADVQRDLSAAAHRAIGLLRWRGGELGPVRPFKAGATVSWRLGGSEYRFPGGVSGSVRMDRLLEVRPSGIQDLAQLAAAGRSEPFAYELLREAWALADINPRSALLIAITALEVGAKQYIAERVKAAEWLVNNQPAPDVIAVLRDYLPTLEPPPGASESASKLELPDDLLPLLRKRRDQRNKITHRPDVYQQATPVATPERKPRCKPAGRPRW